MQKQCNLQLHIKEEKSGKESKTKKNKQDSVRLKNEFSDRVWGMKTRLSKNSGGI